MIATFWTPTRIPIDAFTIMSATAKFGEHPIGRFGTGLKYAIAIILRYGGSIRLFIDGVEYEFYLKQKDFRGKTLDTIRLRKRYGVERWMKSIQLPFTTHLGSTWELWMAYRELHSNTMDENGFTGWDEPLTTNGTQIRVSCPGFHAAVIESEAFMQCTGLEVLHQAPLVTIYDKPSKYLYLNGIRVYTLRYPARFTYDMHAPYVELTEDRTIGNLWSVLYDISHMFMQNEVKAALLKKVVSQKEDGSDSNTFEARELNFYADAHTTPLFTETVYRYASRGLGSYAASTFYDARQAVLKKTSATVIFSEEEIQLLVAALTLYEDTAGTSDILNLLMLKLNQVNTLPPLEVESAVPPDIVLETYDAPMEDDDIPF